MPKELKHGIYTLKTQQMLTVFTMPERLENNIYIVKTHQMCTVCPDNAAEILKQHLYAENASNFLLREIL